MKHRILILLIAAVMVATLVAAGPADARKGNPNKRDNGVVLTADKETRKKNKQAKYDEAITAAYNAGYNAGVNSCLYTTSC